MSSTKDMFASIVASNQAVVVEKSFHELLKMGITARELLTALQSPSFEAHLDTIKIPVLGAPESASERASARAEGEAPVKVAKKRGRPARAKKEEGVYKTYTDEEKHKMRKLIYKTAEKSPKVSTPELLELISKEFDGVADHVTKKLIMDMVDAKNLKMIAGKPNRFQVGKVELE